MVPFIGTQGHTARSAERFPKTGHLSPTLSNSPRGKLATRPSPHDPIHFLRDTRWAIIVLEKSGFRTKNFHFLFRVVGS